MIDSNEGGMGVQSAVIRPERSRLFAAVAGLLVLTGLMAFFPSACVGLALLTPLLGCPLAGSGRQWAAWLAAAAPAALSLLYRFDPLYSLSLLLPGTLPMALTLWLKARKSWPLPSPSAYTSARMPPRLRWSRWRPHMRSAQGLPKGWRSWLAAQVEASDQPGLLLYRFAAAGLLAVPDGYSGALPLFCWTLGWCGRCCCLCG